MEDEQGRRAAGPSRPPIVRLAGVGKSYSSGGEEHAVLKGLDLEVMAGQTVVIRGVSGSGKTTLLNLIGGIDRASSGTVEACGESLDGLGRAAMTAFRRHRIGFIFQFYNLLPTLTALENVALGLEVVALPPREVAARALQALTDIGLRDKAGKFPEQMSGGEQQRVAIARALAKEPPLLLADEPTGNLDEVTTASVLDLLAALSQRTGTTLVLVTHDPAVTALADRRFVLRGGRLGELAAAEGLA